MPTTVEVRSIYSGPVRRSLQNLDKLKVPDSRLIDTEPPLQGGGALGDDLTLTIDEFTDEDPGIVPESGGGTAKFLRADGQWATVCRQVAIVQADLAGTTLATGWQLLSPFVTFTADATHRYEVSPRASFVATADSYLNVAITGGGLVTDDGYAQSGFTTQANTHQVAARNPFFVGPGCFKSLSGTVTLRLNAYLGTGGAAQAIGPAAISVIDLGAY